MKPSKKLQRWLGAFTLASFGLGSVSTPALAYEARNHQDFTNFAFNVMRLVAYQQTKPDGSVRTPTITPTNDTSLWSAPTGADPVQWKAFLDKISDSHWRLLNAPAGLPNVGDCAVAGERLVDLPNLDGNQAKQGEHIGFHEMFLNNSRVGDKKCIQEEKRGSLIEDLNRAFPHGQIAGSALGAHAADPDYYETDWRVFINLLESAVAPGLISGIPPGLHNLFDKTFATGTTIALAPFFCLVRVFKGKSCSIDDIRDFGDRANVLPQVRGLLAAPLGKHTSFKSSFTTGLGHLMNLTPFQQSTFDDISGFHQERSGWRGRPGQVDVEIMLAGDIIGGSIEPTKSQAPRAYEILHNEVRDDHPASAHRSDARWRSATIGHQQFTPLDNLAYYGWQKAVNANFPDAPTGAPVVVAPAGLARPLHALGDASAPHHMIGGLGWGHRPYERLVKSNWDDVQFLDTGSEADQYKNMRAILLDAFAWWTFIQNWRASFQPAYPLDIPVRGMITKLMKRNYSFIVSGSETKFENSRVGLLDLPDQAFPYFDTLNDRIEDHYDGAYARANKVQMGHLINNSVASIVAFLTAAGESMSASFCGDGMVETKEQCDDKNTVNGDGCSANCSVEADAACDDSWPSQCSLHPVCGNGIVEVGESCEPSLRPDCNELCQWIVI